jgi:CBS domain-containing protein
MPCVKDILARKGHKVWSTSTTFTVLDATHAMNQYRVGALLVKDDGEVVGIFTERDVLTRVVAAGLDPKTTPVEEVMSTPVAYCTPETTLETVKSIFTEQRIRHLPVINEDRLDGMITSGDILAFEASDLSETVRFLEEYIHS